MVKPLMQRVIILSLLVKVLIPKVTPLELVVLMKVPIIMVIMPMLRGIAQSLLVIILMQRVKKQKL
jgi:hypothetical protein